jgi:hypothetical protein
MIADESERMVNTRLTIDEQTMNKSISHIEMPRAAMPAMHACD